MRCNGTMGLVIALKNDVTGGIWKMARVGMSWMETRIGRVEDKHNFHRASNIKAISKGDTASFEFISLLHRFFPHSPGVGT